MPKIQKGAIPNELLAALPAASYRRLEAHLETVPLVFGEVLHEPAKPFGHVYFPCSGFISLLSVVKPQKAAEICMVGIEGVAGLAAADGTKVSQLRSVVQGAGSAMRLAASRFHAECASNPAWAHVLLRFANHLTAQAAQTSVCNRYHTIGLRLARWLLLTRDRMGSNTFDLTHQFLSGMLGVQRVGVTVAASELERLGLITYSRGKIWIVNPKGLEGAACECYKVVKGMRAGGAKK